MFDRIITFSVRNKLVVGAGVLVLVIWGVTALRNLPIDAVPDITNNQVQVVTLSPSLAPQEVERIITMPVELTLASIPGIIEQRSISRFGLSVVTLVFDDDVDVFWARAQVDQRLIEIQAQIPQGTGTPMLAPVTTGLGEIFQYTLRVKPGYEARYSTMDLRGIQDWLVRRRLLGTPGVADVSSFGGHLRQVEIAADPERLRTFGLTMIDLMDAVERNNANAGGAYIERGPSLAYIRTEGAAKDLGDIGRTMVKRTENGTPLYVHDVAEVRNGFAVRYGAMTRDDRGEAVGGIVLMLKGANSSKVINDVKLRVAAINKTLPEGVYVEPFLDRTRLVNKAISTVTTNLLEGALIVILVLVLMLGNIRAGVIVASVIPLSMLFAIGMMDLFGVSGNLMSLGALDFGLIVDGAVIIVENVLHGLTHGKGHATSTPAEREGVITRAAVAIRRNAAFGEFIIMLVYLPILVLVGIEGKMFRPMAQTVMFAVLGAFLLSTTYVPMMSALLLRKGIRERRTIADRIIGFLHLSYDPIRRLALRWRWFILGSSLAALIAAGVAFMSMGSEFIPTLDEGDFAVEMRLPTGSSLTSTIATAQHAAEILQRSFPEVVTVIGKIGTSEIPLDPMPIESGDLIIILKDKHEWTSATSREALAERMQQALSSIPGVTFGFQQPIQMRFNELMTGARQDVVVKIFGDDLDTLASLARRIGDITLHVNGAQDIYVEPIGGLPQVVVKADREACARLGVTIDDVNATVRAAFAGEHAGAVYEGERVIDAVIRLDTALRHDVSTFDALTVKSADGQIVPIRQVADIRVMSGPNQVQREDTRRRISVGFNVRGRDVASIVDELHTNIERRIDLPPGYEITYGGQFENLANATARLAVAVPAALLLILVLLYATFKTMREALLIFSAIPLASIGGVAALLLRGMPFSISAGVGFIALFGVAVLNGIVLLSSFKGLRASGRTNVLRIVIEGTSMRLRPVAMTAMVASLGFLPMALSTGDGAEVQRPLATVVIGGLITSTMLTLIVLPILYTLIEGWRMRSAAMRNTTIALLLLCAVGGAQAQQRVTRDDVRRRATDASIVAREARAEAARADVLRDASIDLGRTSVNYMRGQFNSTFIDDNLTITQTIPFPIGMVAQRDAANARADAATAQAHVLERRAAADAERAYDRVVYLSAMLHLLDAEDSVLQRSMATSALREQTGEGTRLERITAEARRAEIMARRLRYDAEYRSAMADLALACGTTDVLVPADTMLAPLDLPRDTVMSDALSNALMRRADAADADRSAARAAWWPDITLGYFDQSLQGTQVVNGTEVTYTAADRFNGFTVGLQLPLWFLPTSARANDAALRAAFERERTQWQRSEITLRAQRLRDELQAARRMLDHYRTTALPAAELLAQQARLAWDAGDVDADTYLHALLRSLDVRTAALDAVHHYNLRVIDLITLLGQ